MAENNSEKIYVSYSRIHELVSLGCQKVIEDNYTPEALVGVSSGGLMPVRIAKTFLKNRLGLKELPIYLVGFSNYDSKDVQLSEPVLTQRFDSELEKRIAGKKILMVDEVDDSRKTLEKAADYLLGLCVQELRILVLHSKDKEKQGVLPEGVKFYYAEKVPPLWIKYQWDSETLF